jgi:hypothetical protein
MNLVRKPHKPSKKQQQKMTCTQTSVSCLKTLFYIEFLLSLQCLCKEEFWAVTFIKKRDVRTLKHSIACTSCPLFTILRFGVLYGLDTECFYAYSSRIRSLLPCFFREYMLNCFFYSFRKLK